MAYCKHPEEVCCNMTFYGGKIYCDNIDGFCHLHDEPPTSTNADRIRAMSDEELAIMFAILRADLSRLDAAIRPYSGRDVNDNYDWLKQPADEDVKGENDAQ